MKNKALKSFIATFLAAVIAFSCFTASFAANDNLVWDFYGDTYTYEYAGTLVEGENETGSLDSDSIWFDFEAQAAGFYNFSYDHNDADFWLDVPESVENGVAYGFSEKLTFSGNNITNFLFCLEEGEHIIGMDSYYSEHDSVLKVEYLGEEITAVETAQETILLGSDVYCYNFEYGEEYFYSLYEDINIIFSSGKTLTTEHFEGNTDREIKKGENIIPLLICGKEYNLTANVALISDYVDNIEVSNLENYLDVKTYYNGFDSADLYGETLTVTFKDGSSAEVSFTDDDMIAMPNGSEAWFGYYYSAEDGKAFLNIHITDTLIESYECNKIPVNFKENIDELNSTQTNLINDVSEYIRRAMISVLECDDIHEYLEYGAGESMFYLIWAYEAFTNIFREAFNLIRYYIA